MSESSASIQLYTGFVYLIYNNINNKVYIGETIRSINKRFKEHIYEANKKSSDKVFYLYRAIRKYGLEHFFIKEISRITGTNRKLVKQEIQKLEKEFICKYDSFNNGYNSNSGGLSPNEISVETRNLQSKIKLENPNTNIILNKARETSIENRQCSVICYNYETAEIINKFISIKEAAKYYNIDSSGITKVCNNKLNYLGKLDNIKLTWRYEDNPYIMKYVIAAYDDNEKLIQKFMTIKDASIKFNVDSSSIIKCCKGKVQHAGNYNKIKLKWKYLTTEDYA